jgi:DNA adenine methylase
MSASGLSPVRPLLRWAGSKRSLLPILNELLPDGARYYEPFAGSACLYFLRRPRQAVLGDLNAELIGFYRTVRRRHAAVAARATEWSLDQDTYYRVRALRPADLDSVSRAARFLYLNRLCFNGVYRENRRGEFNVPYGSRSGQLPSADELAQCSRALRGVDLRCGDFEQTVRDVRAGDVVYLDPPYTQAPDSAHGVYGYGSFNGNDLDRMLALLGRLDDNDVRFLFSYSAVSGIHLRPHWRLREVEVAGRLAADTSRRLARRELLMHNLARAA